MADPQLRYKVDLGDPHDPRAPRHAVRALEDVSVRTAIENYLELTGVLINRRNPRGWFFWLDPVSTTVFIARCSDPPAPNAPDDKWQPWHYFVEAEVAEQEGRATATDFYHEDFLSIS